MKDKLNFRVFPNPASEQIYISFENTQKKSATINLISPFGQIVKSVETRNDFEIVNIHDLQNGVYFLSIGNATGMAIEKIIVQN